MFFEHGSAVVIAHNVTAVTTIATVITTVAAAIVTQI
jgi:hypothetical protein